MRPTMANLTPEPTAAALFVCGCVGKSVTLWLRRSPVSGGCGSAFCSATPHGRGQEETIL
jgi:hypothetical protein